MLIVSLLLELLIYYTPLWHWRKLAAVPVMLLVIGDAAWFATIFPRPVVAVYALLAACRVIHLLRLIKNRAHEQRLHRIAKRTLLVLFILQVGLAELTAMWLLLSDSRIVLAGIQAVFATLVVVTTAHNLYKTRHLPSKDFYTDKELPTVTVAIPARNETQELTACLTSVIANNYPKLEILVLDDCSQDKTSEIIKSFAQDGVRFLKGEEPNEELWLAKNQAYDQLTKAATGEYIIFMGATVRLGPDAIRGLIASLLHKNKSMMSVIPLRVGTGIGSSLVQPLRYWWELALPRKLFNRPATSSTLWAIKRDDLLSLGGFGAVSRSILPEGYFARELVKTDGYSLARANEELEIRTIKSTREQWETALRDRYPQLRRRFENAVLLLVIEAVLLFAPFAMVVAGCFNGFGLAEWLALAAGLLLVISQVLIISVTNPGNTVLGLLNLPFAILTEALITLVSVFKYEFGTIAWKDRNICIPVMHVYPRLPKV